MALSWSLAPTVGSTGSTLVGNKVIYATAITTWVAVGSRSGSIPTSTGLVWTSADGLTWTLRTAAKGYNWRSVAFSPTLGSGSGRLVAVTSSTLTGGGASITDQVMYSDDGGVTWTSATSAERNAWQDVVWADALSLFVAVSSSGTHRVMTSADGITWATQTAASAVTWTGIAWDGTTLVAVAGTTGTTSVMTSTNGTSWTSRTTSITIGFKKAGVAYSSALGMFVGVGTNGSSVVHVVRSTDSGVTWSDWAGTPSGASTSDGNQIAAASTAMLVLSTGNSTAYVLTSTDGNTWTKTAMSNAGGDNFSRTWDALGCDGSTFALTDQSAHDTIALGSSTNIQSGTLAATGAAVAVWSAGLTVSSITPSTGFVAGGDEVTITGSGFIVGATVQFGRYFGNFDDATDVVVVSATQITCNTPRHTPDEIVTVVVTNPSTEFAALVNGFTYTIPSYVGGSGSFTISPNHGPMAGNTLVTITGNGTSIDPASTVLFDGVAATSVTPVSADVITCRTPAHTQGTVDVSILN